MLITAVIIISEAKTFEYEWVKIRKSHILACLHHMTEIFFKVMLGNCMFPCVDYTDVF